MDKFATYCTKCGTNYEGRPKVCDECGNKAYLKVQAKLHNSVVLTEHNKEFLEYHCRVVVPDDVLCVVPSSIAMLVGYKELVEKEKRRAVQREKVAESRKRRAKKNKKPKKD